jgi:hypothetical protein
VAALMSYCINKKIDEHSYMTQGMSGNYTYQFWFYDSNYSVCHKIDGPAVIRMELSLPNDQKINAYQEWWYMGTKLNCSSQEEFERILKLKVFW